MFNQSVNQSVIILLVKWIVLFVIGERREWSLVVPCVPSKQKNKKGEMENVGVIGFDSTKGLRYL